MLDLLVTYSSVLSCRPNGMAYHDGQTSQNGAPDLAAAFKAEACGAPIPTSPINVVRIAISFVSPSCTVHAPMSPLITQRAAGILCISTVSEPLMIGGIIG